MEAAGVLKGCPGRLDGREKNLKRQLFGLTAGGAGAIIGAIMDYTVIGNDGEEWRG